MRGAHSPRQTVELLLDSGRLPNFSTAFARLRQSLLLLWSFSDGPTPAAQDDCSEATESVRSVCSHLPVFQVLLRLPPELFCKHKQEEAASKGFGAWCVALL